MNTILKERDACGVGIIANLANDASHKVVEKALTALGCMEHRGGCSADDDSGDGAGIMVQVPWKILEAWASAEGKEFDQHKTGLAQVFLPNDEAAAAASKKVMEQVLEGEGFRLVGWRVVPVNLDVVGKFAKATQPIIEQAIVESTTNLKEDELERALYMVRKLIEAKGKTDLDSKFSQDFYICSMSSRTIVYKGMLRSVVVGQFYLDLKDTAFESAFAIYHRRFSTNTTPKWPLAQPMRILGHNGEINTLQGNLNWAASREANMTHPVWNGRESELRPITDDAVSDSANLDRVAELLVRSDTGIDETMLMLVPEAYRNHPTLEERYPAVKDFYDYYAGMQEAWDGPALIVFTDGRTVGARLDRNGLRPARYWRTTDGFLYVASEVGVFDDVLSDASNVEYKGRLGPGMCVTAKLGSNTFRTHGAVCRGVAEAKPYKKWLEAVNKHMPAEPLGECQLSAQDALKMQAAYGYSGEDVELVIQGMATGGIEPTYCMGDDTALPVLASSSHMLYDYFKQRFAQVTNPAIDPLREGLVMSLDVHLGARGNILMPGPDSLPKMVLSSPVLLDNDLNAITSNEALQAVTLPTRFVAGGKSGALKAALEELCTAAAEAVEKGAQVLVLSDRCDGLNAESPAIPAMLAVGAVHHHLIQCGLRMNASIVSDNATTFSTHHLACLVGYGASAVCPHLALESVRQFHSAPRTQTLMKNGKLPPLDMEDMQQNFAAALNKGLKKILSKMGISLLSSYSGAQIFEIYGLGQEVVETAFKGSVSRIGGLTLDELAAETESFWKNGFPEQDMKKLDNFGFYSVRPGLEYHSNNGDLSKLLHKAIGLGGKASDPEAFEAYAKYLEEAPVTTLRDMLQYKSDRKPVALEEVESIETILNRFCTGGMSLGAISRECHETIAVAMNRIGGKSNSGEGGEDVLRFSQVQDVDNEGRSQSFAHLNGLKNGDIAFSSIKQVASGRFGVTPFFLMNANQLEIKVSQGAKPGEGGQLPGKKVSPYIASLRASKPGVPLISPPPHHDIYSIEDLAQLIYDLHQINPVAKVSVKLVGEAGIGTVASGVAKAGADIIQVSGHDGGTGASPISSIKHAGGPWEMGLVETHQTLNDNGLRERVVLRADGGFKSGRDVMMAALMGADEYGFGTVAMIATGCIMARICHTNNCPVGVASQREELRARMPGTPSDVVNFFVDVAMEVRSTLAELGYKSMDEIIGRSDLLEQSDKALSKTSALDLGFLVGYTPVESTSTERREQATHTNGPVLDEEILAMDSVQAAIKDEGVVDITIPIVNTDRAFGGRIAGVIANSYGNSSFAGSLNINLEGSAGQSFGVWTCGGMKLRLYGEANDYVGKGMAGGEIAILPPKDCPIPASDAVIVGNTCLYGATGGRLLANGRAGERFAVRNSLAEAVVEGAGDHCCEYMTGGCIVVLGKVGRNVGAGMTGGLGYFLDEAGTFLDRVNGEIVRSKRIESAVGEKQLRDLIELHVDRTGSAKGQEILNKWDEMLPKFWQVVPPSEAGSPEVIGNETQPAEIAIAA
eukprot:CAMPEP_0114250742 /NCGR_PEP_ID=MMETSP0058-20121206/14870_1 /TAXON_ID=36894 /ORGANISM="Pyramimonas parkeae, CCMP726" /LENGTH=1531 /DNA_ID=CAMNT_0001364439 /DNA_START=430 /DNA_END=5025 /DNA_ORIENTATION=+